jgi:uncharacterized membrane protein YphA (DoxX/SURF4 family)
MSNQKLSQILLRISIASVFMYAGVAGLIAPYNWIGYIPLVLRDMFSPQLLLFFFSIFEVLLALWVLSGWKTFFSSGIAAMVLLAIITANFNQLDILFRDFAIFFAAGALLVSSFPKKA